MKICGVIVVSVSAFLFQLYLCQFHHSVSCYDLCRFAACMYSAFLSFLTNPVIKEKRSFTVNF